MRIALYVEDDESFGEIWELSDEYRYEFDKLFGEERMRELWKFVREKGIKVIDSVDFNITLPAR